MASRSISSSTGGNRKDPAWKYGTQVVGEGKGYIYIKCNFCNRVITGGVKRMKDHLGHTHKNVAACSKVPDEVKEEITQYLNKSNVSKQMKQARFEERVNDGSYIGNPSCSYPRSDDVSSGFIRGPMDRYVSHGGIEEDELEAEKETPTPAKNAKEARDLVVLDIGRFFFENAIPFNAVRSPSFANMCRSVGRYGKLLKMPSMYELSTWALEEEIHTTKNVVNDVRKTWKHTGVSILSDGWSDGKSRALINFFVNNPEGTIFLKSVDVSAIVKDAPMLFKLLDSMVEEVGEQHVVQVVTDNASAYKAAGAMLMQKRRKLFWTPCAAHCIDLMLEKSGDLPQHRNALLKAKKVSNFIYNHGVILALMRKHTGRELIRPAITRFATSYLTLQSMLQSKKGLEAMFVSNDWDASSWASKREGKEVKKIILKDKNFWPSVVYAIKTTKPLVAVLRMVDGEKVPAMGFIYGAMDKAKEDIAKNLNNEEASYKEIWEIIDAKWEFQMHRDLHSAAYFLNPQHRYSENFSTHPEIKEGLFACMEKLIADPFLVDKATLQLDEYSGKIGMFGLRHAQTTVQHRAPANWWMTYGDGVPELRDFAVKVLSLTCSASACERNWSTFNQVHTKRRNRLSTVKMNKLVYIMYNKKLKDRHFKKISLKDDDDPLLVDDVPSDDEWVVDVEDESSNISMTEENLVNVDIEEFHGGNERANTQERETQCYSRKRKGKEKESMSNADLRGGKGKRPMTMMDRIDEEDFLQLTSEEDDDMGIRYHDDSFDDSTSSDDDAFDW